jgi:hypothetical protein
VLGLCQDGHLFEVDYAVGKATFLQRVVTVCKAEEYKHFLVFLELIMQEGPEGECRIQPGSRIQEDAETARSVLRATTIPRTLSS